MENNKLIPYKENIFTKISNFFKKLFFRKQKTQEEKNESTPVISNQARESFKQNIEIKENQEEKRLKELQFQYENGEIDEEDISEEDMEKLIEMYEKETNQLNEDTEKRKNHISKMLKELKNN